MEQQQQQPGRPLEMPDQVWLGPDGHSPLQDGLEFPGYTVKMRAINQDMFNLTFMRYSTARSGLLKLARMALSTCSLGNPISTILLIADCSPSPERKELRSPKAGAGAEGVDDGAAIVTSGVGAAAAAAGAVDGAVEG